MTPIDELTGKLLDRTLTDTEGAELDGLLTSDPAAPADHLALLDVEAALRGLRTDLDLVGPTLDRVKEAQAEHTAAAVLAEIHSHPVPAWHPHRRTGPRKRLAVFGGVGVVAVAAALVIGLWRCTPGPSRHSTG